MKHVRRQILDGLAGLLGELGHPVHDDALYALPANEGEDPPGELPAYVVEPDTEPLTVLGETMRDEPVLQDRTLRLDVWAIAYDRPKADAMGLAAEKAIDGSGLGIRRRLESTSFPKGKGRRPIYAVLMKWTIRYQTSSDEPENAR